MIEIPRSQEHLVAECVEARAEAFRLRGALGDLYDALVAGERVPLELLARVEHVLGRRP